MAEPTMPNYTQLAQQTQQSNQQAMNGQTTANRPNQVNSQGSLQWTQDPTTGAWTQTTSLNPALGSTQDTLNAGANGLAGQAVSNAQQPLDYSGISGVDQYDPTKFGAMPDSGFGAVQQVQDAMNSRLQPGLDQSRAALIQRLRSQGLSQDSNAYQRAITGQDQKDVDSSQQALLAATSAYGDIFNRGLASRQQQSNEAQTGFTDSTSDRARQIAEMQTQRGQPLSDLKGLLGASSGIAQPTFQGFNTSGNAGGVDYYGAGKDTYGDALGSFNAQTARNAANKQSNINLGTTIGSGLLSTYGDDVGTYLKGLFGG